MGGLLEGRGGGKGYVAPPLKLLGGGGGGGGGGGAARPLPPPLPMPIYLSVHTLSHS